MFERIAYSTDLGEIAMMTSLLKAERIDVPELFRSGHVSIAGIDHGFYLHVSRDDAARARAALNDSDFRHCLTKEK